MMRYATGMSVHGAHMGGWGGGRGWYGWLGADLSMLLFAARESLVLGGMKGIEGQQSWRLESE